MKQWPKYSSREAQALAEVGRTSIRPAMAGLLMFVFLGIIAMVPITQQVVDIGQQRASAWPQCYDIFRKPPAVAQALKQKDRPLLKRLITANRALMRAMQAYEIQIENDSRVGALLRMPTQYILARWLGAGNDKTYCGRRPWLFYRPEIESLVGPGFLEPRQLARRAAQAKEWQAPPQANPIPAILHLRDQLAQRGIALIVMPTPVKPMVHPEKFTRAYSDWPRPLQNQSYIEFTTQLRKAGVLLFDITEELVARKRDSGQSQYLATDTHWRPEAMLYCASRLKDFIEQELSLPPMPEPGYQTRLVSARQLGDLALMLKLPPSQTAWPRETVALRQVLDAQGMIWRPDAASDILVLGDSFCNIYSLESLGWGGGAGLIEQLSQELKRPLDRITLNDNGANATRVALGRELAQGRDRLAGKRLVIYQFAARELTEGDWKIVDLRLAQALPAKFLLPPAGTCWPAQGLIKDITAVPRPGSVPYKDHVLSLHLVDITCAPAATSNGQAVVYLQSMRDNTWTAAARLQPGAMIKLQLRAWSDVAVYYEGINRTELENIALQLQEPCWGEDPIPIQE